MDHESEIKKYTIQYNWLGHTICVSDVKHKEMISWKKNKKTN